MSSELPTAAPGVRVPKHHRGGTFLRRQLGVGAHKGDRHAARLLKSHAIAFVGEFVGTLLFTLFAFTGTTVASLPATSVTSSGATADAGAVQPSPNTSSLLYVALSFGFSLTVNATIFAGVSGGIFNPAISLGLALIGAHTPIRALILTVAQVVGSICGAAITSALLPGPLNVRTTLVAGTSIARGLFIEMFLTCLLMLTVLVVTVEKSAIGADSGSIAPVSIGLALFLAELCGVFYTGGSLNPSRSLGPDVVLGKFDSYHWIYWVGPGLGATVAVLFWRGIQWVHFELGPRAAGTPEASKMLLDGPNQDAIGEKSILKDQEGKGNGRTNVPAQGDLSHTFSRQSDADARSMLSVVSAAAPEPQDRIAILETSNQRIEAMLRSLTAGAGQPGSPVTTAAASIATRHRKLSGEEAVHGEDQLYAMSSR
ncbi:hypothetical protein JCM10908_006090 [Rhodotorula pacifica]|uniref:uncharacterized protein n=1 Tax=Rhodotorula pacifica TaxID=1495444 RepID=UPI003173ED40